MRKLANHVARVGADHAAAQDIAVARGFLDMYLPNLTNDSNRNLGFMSG